jgi:hypothetical protein
MNDIGKPEGETQRRVIALFRDELGNRFLGDWTDRDGSREQLIRNSLFPPGASGQVWPIRWKAPRIHSLPAGCDCRRHVPNLEWK